MNLLIFKYDEMDGTSISNISTDITTVEIDGEPWFVASDVCKLLELTNVSESLNGLDEDEKLTSVILRSGQNRRVNLISESGLYSLVFKSRKPFAKKFCKWVTKVVIPSIRKTGTYSINRNEMPNFIVRYNDNWDRVEKGYFSVISELFVRLYGRFHHIGYDIPNKAFNGKEIRPDVSVGKCFASYLKLYYPELAGEFKFYKHKFPNGMELDARQYKNALLPIFIQYVDDEWIPKHAEDYFKSRDPKALDYLPKLLEDKSKAAS